MEAIPARWSAEVAATKTMLERAQESLGLTPRTLAADAAYGSGLMLGWLMGRDVEPHIPILDRAHQTKGYFTRADFTFDAAANAFVCPTGKRLLNKGLVRDDGTMPYRASTKDCRDCALKVRCTKSSKRIVTRNLYEAEREHVRGLKETPAFKCSARLRKKVEMRFAHLKRNLNCRRLRLRGLTWRLPLRICKNSFDFLAELRQAALSVPRKHERRSTKPSRTKLGGTKKA